MKTECLLVMQKFLVLRICDVKGHFCICLLHFLESRFETEVLVFDQVGYDEYR